jgi:hypothetical protein
MPEVLTSELETSPAVATGVAQQATAVPDGWSGTWPAAEPPHVPHDASKPIPLNSRIVLLAQRLELSNNALKVYLWLRDLAPEGKCRFPGLRPGARGLFLSYSSWKRAIDSLEDSKLILVQRNSPLGDNDVLIIPDLPPITERDYYAWAQSFEASTGSPESKLYPQIDGPGGARLKKGRKEKAERRDRRKDAAKEEKPAQSATEKLKKTNLDDATKTRICSSPGMMNRYLIFGADSLDVPVEKLAEMPPSPTDFRRPESDPTVFERWSIPQFAAFFWFRVTEYRAGKGIPLTMPPFGELGGRISRMMSTEGWGYTRRQVYDHIVNVSHHFELIQELVGPDIRLTFDVNAIDHKLIREKLQLIVNLSPDQVTQLWQETIARRQRREQWRQQQKSGGFISESDGDVE